MNLIQLSASRFFYKAVFSKPSKDLPAVALLGQEKNSGFLQKCFPLQSGVFV
jgi:hypothetical protein